MKLKRTACLLFSLLLCAVLLAPMSVSAADADEHLVFHYNFQGGTANERLTNKVSGSNTGALTLTTKNNKSHVEDGYAYINSAQGEYLSTVVGNDVKSITQTATLYLSFAYIAPNPNSVGDVVQIGSTVRVAANTDGRLFTRMGSGITSAANTQVVINNPSTTGGEWVRMAVTMEFDAAGNVKEVVYLSANDGVTWAKTEATLGGDKAALGMFSGAGELLLGKVSKSIADRGFSFYIRDVRLYDSILTEEEVKAISLKDVTIKDPDVPVVTPDPTDPADPNRDIKDHLIVHYDFLGSNAEEMLRDKATAGNSAEDLMMYSSITDGKKDSYLKDGMAYISSKQSNCMFAIPGEDVKGIEKSMTAFFVFSPTWENRSNPGDFFAMDNNVRFGFHNANDQLFSGVGANFGGGGTSSNVSGGLAKSGDWVYAAVTLIWDGETDKVLQVIHYSRDKGETWSSSSSRISTDLPTMYSNATYMVFGKIAPGMSERGTNFLFDDIRIYDCALTLDELKSIEVEPYGAEKYPPQTDIPGGNGGDEDETTTEPGTETTTGDSADVTGESGTSAGTTAGTGSSGTSAGEGCTSVAFGGVCAISLIAAGAAVLKKKRD